MGAQMCRIRWFLWITIVALTSAGGALARAPKPLQIYLIDVEGGQATLVVGPSHESMLIDTGWPNFNGRDAERIARDAKAATIKQMEYVLITYGKFRFIDLGDLTKKKELELACLNNLVGKVDLYLVTHHGLDQSNAKAIVWGLHPRVAVMNNGAHKGGNPEAWQTVHDSPGLEDLWQLHYSEDAGKDHNTGEKFIANSGGKDGNYIKVAAEPDGRFTVENSGNKFRKEYK